MSTLNVSITINTQNIINNGDPTSILTTGNYSMSPASPISVNNYDEICFTVSSSTPTYGTSPVFTSFVDANWKIAKISSSDWSVDANTMTINILAPATTGAIETFLLVLSFKDSNNNTYLCIIDPVLQVVQTPNPPM